MKKSQRFSFKKLTPSHKKQESKLFEESTVFNKSKVYKPKSSQKANQVAQPNHKFKVYKYGVNDKYQHLRTQANESHSRAPYQKYPNIRKKEKARIDKNKTNFNLNETKKNQRTNNQKSLSSVESKQKNIKKLQLNQELFRIIRNSSAEKHHDAHPTTKNNYQSFRKPHESHRSVYKKTALEDYISNSLENLKPNKKALPKPDQKMLRKEEKVNDTVLRERKQKLKNLLVYQDITQELKHKDESVQRQSKLQKNEQKKRRIHTDKDDSLDNFKIKFEKANKYDLSKEEIQMFGDRFPDGFDKIKLLGRGGFSLVWLGQHKKSKKKYAVKQIITESSHQTHIKEIWFGTYFFEFGGAPKEEFLHHPGINNLVKLYYYFINKKDTWILYEKCGDSLGNALYDLKGERINNQKLYRIHYKSLYTRIRNNQNQLRKIILEVAKALELLAENNIVHSDLKTENILVRNKTQEETTSQNDDGTSIAETKLIDYGSSFVFNNLRQFSMATPQYMAPEILNFILYENELQYIQRLLEYVQKYTKPWVIDVWSLGCVVLEIVSGIPLWMSLKTVVKRNEIQTIKYGLFAVKGRLFDKIIRKQIEVIQNLDHFLYEQNYSGIVLEEDIRALLKRMLALNPEKRISPTQIIQFLTEENSSQSQKQQ